MHDQKPVNLMEEMDNARKELKSGHQSDEVKINRVYLIAIVGTLFILASIVMLIITIINKERFSFDIIMTFVTGYILLSIHMRLGDIEAKSESQDNEIKRLTKALRDIQNDHDKKKGN
jgi:uncharacterized membrane protein